MPTPLLWQETTTQQLAALLQPHPDIRALLIVGSAASNTTDQWSDLDAIIIVSDDRFSEWFPSLAWLEPLGTLFAFEQHPGQNRGTTRVCFTDGRRLDLIITTESSFLNSADFPLWDGARVIFSDAEQVRLRASQIHPRPSVERLEDEKFTTFAHQFWFRAVIAVEKVVRDDLLIGLHLCLESVQDTCVLAMMLRDRQEGTMIHKTGGIGNLFVEQFYTPMSPTANGILDSLGHTSQAFDTLAAQWSLTYEPRFERFSSWLEEARKKRETE